MKCENKGERGQIVTKGNNGKRWHLSLIAHLSHPLEQANTEALL